LSKILGGSKPNKIEGQVVAITDEYMGVSQLLGRHVPRLPLKSMPMEADSVLKPRGNRNVLRDQQDMAKILETNLAHSMG